MDEATSESTAPVDAKGTSGAKQGMLDRPFLDMVLVDAALLLIVAMVVFSGGNPAGLLLYLPIALPGIIGAFLAMRNHKPWAYLLTTIGLLLMPLLLMAYQPQSAVDPARGPEFVATLLLLLSAALGVPAAIAGYRRAKKGAAQLSARDGLRTRWGIASVLVTGLMFGAMLAGIGAWANATAHAGSSSDLTPEATVSLAAENFLFSPPTIQVPLGQLVEVTVVNKDPAYHTFTYTTGGKTYSHDLLPSSTTKFMVFFTTAGDIRYWCIPHEAMGMVGTMQVA